MATEGKKGCLWLLVTSMIFGPKLCSCLKRMKGNIKTFLIVVIVLHRHGRLSWHDGRIPEDEEIWVKIGGDKGGGTFKVCFQIVNVIKCNQCIVETMFSPLIWSKW